VTARRVNRAREVPQVALADVVAFRVSLGLHANLIEAQDVLIDGTV